jgi:hypothetical protein
VPPGADRDARGEPGSSRSTHSRPRCDVVATRFRARWNILCDKHWHTRRTGRLRALPDRLGPDRNQPGNNWVEGLRGHPLLSVSRSVDDVVLASLSATCTK